MEWTLPPRELWLVPGEPLVNYVRWLWEFPVYLTLLCDLRRADAVLEIGCNHGRTMLGLLSYLESPGKYEGFDIWRRQVEYAQRAVGSDGFSVKFTYADVYNAHYNPDGKEQAHEYRFPYPDRDFDVVFAASVFTHMLPPAVAHYVQETARVLKPGGRALFSVFVLDYFRGAGTTISKRYDYTHDVAGHDGVAIVDPELPESYVAYSAAQLRQMAAAAGLELARTVPGTWSRAHPVGVCEQDLIVLKKPDRDGGEGPSG